MPGLPTSVDYSSTGTVKTLVLTPEIGYFKTFGSGFSIGVDFGVQVPIAPSEVSFQRKVSSGLPDTLVDQLLAPEDEKVKSTLEKLGRTVLPALHVRMGFLL